eukprot:TRINITY_DN1222_c1_g1_i1.p1 TRINITY_DN1222_c1_g1~~TRINITY_DN1222_c1_g1_i1.p1  ORF type:complete len:478 (+),score=103.12 TRINITY_DN1222_c1_g1_i1:62-1495(+)
MAFTGSVLTVALLAVGVAVDLVSDVIELGSANFLKHISEHKYVLVQFQAPWCGHCKKLVPEYERAASVLKASGVSLATVDATVEKDLARKYNVKGFPSLTWFEDGAETEFTGVKNSEGIADWVNSMIRPPVTETSDAPEPGRGLPRVVLHAASLLPGFEVVAKAHRRQATWFYTPANSTKVVIKHSGEESLTSADGAVDEDKIAEFVSDNLLPMFGRLDGDTFETYMDAKKGLVWSLFPADGEDMETVYRRYQPLMTNVARKVRTKFFVTITDTVQFATAIDNVLGVTKFPAIAVQKKAGDKRRYVYQGEMTEKKIVSFIESVDAGGVQPRFKSQPPPTVEDEAVKLVVGSTLQEELFHPSKDVLLEVYSPWCGHCKKLEPEYTKLARKIKKEELTDLLSIATIDGTANDSPIDSVDWKSFPTIYFSKAGAKNATLYDGERTAKGIWKYIRKHATNAQEIRDRIERRKSVGKKAEEL